jgi:hypothetical protein
MESQLPGVSSGQPQLFAEIAQSHDLRALPEQLLRCFFCPVLGGHVVSALWKFLKMCLASALWKMLLHSYFES